MLRGPRVRLKDLPPELRKRAEELERQARAAAREEMLRHFEVHQLPRPTPEHRFHPTRRWRFDLAWPAEKVALEIEGASWGTGPACGECGQRKQGAHTRGKHFRSDMEKYNAAGILGWTVLRTTPEDLYALATVELVRAALAQSRCTPPSR